MGLLCGFTGIVHLVLAGTPPTELAEGEGAVL
jgi:TRAP-type transport system small permease protein